MIFKGWGGSEKKIYIKYIKINIIFNDKQIIIYKNNNYNKIHKKKIEKNLNQMRKTTDFHQSENEKYKEYSSYESFK